MSVRYCPGPWRAIVTPHGFAVLEDAVPAELLGRIWEQLAKGRGFAAVLEALTGTFGTSLAAIPPFAVVLAESGAVRVAVRGAFTIAVDIPGGVEEIAGAGVTTWTERIVAGAVRVAVRRPDAPPTVELPVRDGVVTASAIEWVQETDAASAPRGPWSSSGASPAGPSPEPAAAVPPVEEVPEVPEVLSDQDHAEPSDPPAPDSAGGLIDSIPPIVSADTWLPSDPTLAPVPEPEASVAPVEAATGYDHLWGATVVRSVEDAAVREEAEDGSDDGSSPATASIDSSLTGGAPVEPAASGDLLGDHDGATISAAQARALRGGGSIDADSVPPPLAPPRAPAPGRIRLSTGQELLLDRTVVIGRRPRSTRVSGTDLPHLVAVDSPQQDISRSHLEVRAEGDAILATDLHTTNGTTLLRAGADPVRLHPGEQTVVVAGDLLDLGDGVTVTIEEAP